MKIGDNRRSKQMFVYKASSEFTGAARTRQAHVPGEVFEAEIISGRISLRASNVLSKVELAISSKLKA